MDGNERFVDPFTVPSVEEQIIAVFRRGDMQWRKGGRRHRQLQCVDISVAGVLPCGCRAKLVFPQAPWSALDPHPTMEPYMADVGLVRVYRDGSCVHLGCGKIILKLRPEQLRRKDHEK